MKKQTPMQKIIQFIDESAGQMPLEGVLEYAKYLLKEEKQAIIDAWVDGNKEFFYDGTEDIVANTYFNNKYNTK